MGFTIIVFAKAPIPGRVKTRLGLAPEEAARLHERFAGVTLKLCQQLGLPVELHTDEPTGAWPEFTGPRFLQAAGELGTRMLAAIERRTPALLLGSDAPTLPVSHLLRLMESTDDVTLGPTEDGGYYAIACRRWRPDLFAGVNWSSSTTCEETLRAARGCGLTAGTGPIWFDVDTCADLERLPLELR